MSSIKIVWKVFGLQLILFEVLCVKYSMSVSLYEEKQSIIILDAQNFEHYVYDQNAYTLVNWYLDWCGHCQHFAPIYQQFADDINSWKTIVRVAAINCADSHNSDLCLKHQIRQYPRVQIFAINAKNNDSGSTFTFHNHSVTALRNALIDFLLESQKTFSDRLNLFPINVVSKEELFNSLPIHLGKHNLIFLERPPTHLGVEILMDFSSYTENVVIIRVHDRTGSLSNNLFEHYLRLPSLIRFHRNRKIDLIASAHSEDEELLRKAFGVKIKKLLHIEIPENNDKQTIETDNNKSSIITTDNRVIIEKKNVRPFNAKKWPNLSMTDLYNTLRYSLHDEVERYTILNETQIAVLKKYVSVIYKYFPFDNENVRRFFKRMNNWFANKTDKLKVVDLKAAMKISDGFLLPIVDWKFCNGSKPQFRRYPCGLWSLFHVLTVNEYNLSKENSHEVLHTMKDFIINFFSCKECAKHFGQVSNDLDSHLIQRQSSVLWLWRVHNQVNQRLKGDISEDPFFPKVQFPTQIMCKSCYKSNSEYDEENVLKFLIEHYDENSLSQSNSQNIYSLSKILIAIYLIIQYSLYF